MAHSHATKAQIIEIVNQLGNGRIHGKLAQALIEGRVEIVEKVREQSGTPYRGDLPSGESGDRITVPDLSASELVALAKKALKLTYFSDDLAKWDFIRDERGKTYEVKIWKPGREVVPANEVREHFTDGFVGNTAAFVAWVTKHNPDGYHVSIPEDDRLFQDGGYLHAPYFIRGESYRRLSLSYDVRGRWDGGWAFVAFREVQS